MRCEAWVRCEYVEHRKTFRDIFERGEENIRKVYRSCKEKRRRRRTQIRRLRRLGPTTKQVAIFTKLNGICSRRAPQTAYRYNRYARACPRALLIQAMP